MKRCLMVCLVVLTIPPLPALAAESSSNAGRTAETERGLVVSVSQPASEVGAQVLREGGTAVDAAVATAFALAVTWPEAGNIGGGGFMLVYPPSGEPVCFDYREMAPAAVMRDMFARGDHSQYKLVGVPGTVRGMWLAHQKLGKRPWDSLVQPAVRLAKDGFPVNGPLAASLNNGLKGRQSSDELRRVFAPPEGRDVWQAGDKLIQPELAETLRLIAEQGPDGFYRGSVAEKFVEEMKRGGGLVTLDDLANYTAKPRTPIHGTFRGYDVYGPPPPSSGGTALVEMLNIVEALNLRQYDRWSPTALHLMTEAMKRAYCDRARHLGDPDFVEVPEHLTSKEYARQLAAGISFDKATSSESLAPEISLAGESEQTTHFSVVDANGMAVSNTYTLEYSFGSKIVVRGAGFLLNNELGDFNPKPGFTNRAGKIGTAANEVRAGKRPLSSMTPTIVVKDGKPILVTGSPGGRTIINTVFCVVINKLEYDLPLRESVAAMRMHHQWLPDRLSLEKERLDGHADVVEALRKMGQDVSLRDSHQGDAHSIWIDPKTGQRQGVSDPRRDGWAAGE